MKYYHYTYRITNTKENMHYYGVRTSKNGIHPKDDLGVRYFSSGNKEFRDDQKINHQDYKYKVIRISETRELATQLEIDLHRKFDVGVNPNFHNGSKQTSTKFQCDWDGRSDEEKAIISAKISGSHLNKTDEEKATIADKKRAKWNSRTDAEKAIINSTRSASWYNKTDKEKKDKINRQKMTVGSRSNEEKSKTADKKRAKWNSRTIEERVAVGEQRSRTWHNKTDKEKSQVCEQRRANVTGKKNGRSLKINIYDSENNLQFECHGNFKKICKENNLPFRFLAYSYREDDTSGYMKVAGQHKRFNKFKHCEGWYARKII